MSTVYRCPARRPPPPRSVRWIGAILASVVLAGLVSCGKSGSASARRIVLYTSMDAAIVDPIIVRFTAETGVAVDVVTDTEATKTTGLVQRLVAEKAAPKADVWWSSEIVGTVQLAAAKVLHPYTSLSAETQGGVGRDGAGWPPGCRGAHGEWYALAFRPRCIVTNTKTIGTSPPPASLDDLSEARFAGKGVGIADPAFGTTRGHLAVLFMCLGERDLAAWLKKINWRVYDGNAAVVRAVAAGEVDVGLTDYDDAVAGIANGWPLAVTFTTVTLAVGKPDEQGNRRRFTGVVMTPGSVALVAHPDRDPSLDAAALVDYILSTGVQAGLAEGPWRSIPIGVRAPITDERLRALPILPIPWEVTAKQLPDAAKIWNTRGQ